MERTIDVNNPENLNHWVRKSIELFSESGYLDKILEIYSFTISSPQRLENDNRRELISAHQSRDTKKLLSLLKNIKKFPYDDPVYIKKHRRLY